MLGRRHAFAFASLAPFVTVAVVAASAGCLGRTGLYVDEPVDGAVPIDDASSTTQTQQDSAIVEDSAQVVTDSTVPPTDTGTPPPPPRDTGIDIFDVIPIPDSGPLGACATCVATDCRTQVNACVNDPNCLKGLGCAVTQCLAGGGGDAGGGGGIPGFPGGGGGGFNFACLSSCFGGDLNALFTAFNAFTCVTSSCGTACGGLIPGGGGGGGGGGGIPGFPGGGGGAGGAAPMTMRASSPEALRSIDPATRYAIAPDAFEAWHETLQRSACEQGIASCEAPPAR